MKRKNKIRQNQNNISSRDQLNVITSGTVIRGIINCNSNCLFDGTLIGEIESSEKFVVGKNGIIEGEMNCKIIEVEGKVDGIQKASELLKLRSTSIVKGDLVVAKLDVDDGATLNGNCIMKS